MTTQTKATEEGLTVIYCTYCKTATHADTSCPYQINSSVIYLNASGEVGDSDFTALYPKEASSLITVDIRGSKA